MKTMSQLQCDFESACDRWPGGPGDDDPLADLTDEERAEYEDRRQELKIERELRRCEEREWWA